MHRRRCAIVDSTGASMEAGPDLFKSFRMVMRNWRSSTSSRSALSACTGARGYVQA